MIDVDRRNAGWVQERIKAKFLWYLSGSCPKKRDALFLAPKISLLFLSGPGLFVTKKLPTATLVDVVEVFVVYKIFGGSTYRGVHIEAISSAASHTRVEKDIDYGCRRQRNNIQR